MATCPRCGKQTELMLAAPAAEPMLPRRVIVWTVVFAGILIAGLIVTIVELKHFEKLAAQRRDRAGVALGADNDKGTAGLEVSGVALQKGEGGSGTYAVGKVVNTSGRRRSQVTVEFDLLDAEGKSVEVARAFRPVLEAGAKWQVRVQVAGDSKAVSARLAAIRAAP